MTRPLALVIALLTLAPWAFIVFFFVTFSTVFAQAQTVQTGGGPSNEFFRNFDRIFHLQLLGTGWIVALLIFYIVHLFRTSRVPSDKKALWAVVLLLAHLFAMPVYWYFYIWPKPNAGAA